MLGGLTTMDGSTAINGLVDAIIGTHGYVARGAHWGGGGGGGALLRRGQVIEDAYDCCPAA